MQTLQAKRAVITGAGRGIGRAIAIALAQAGAHVMLSARTTTQIEELAKELQGQGYTAYSTPCDVQDPQAVLQLHQAVHAQMGGVDIVVNNAGIAKSHKFLHHPDSIWHEIIGVNLHGVYYICNAFVPDLIAQQSGRIITIASIASKVPQRYMAAYAASKHAVLGLTRALALELVSAHITVNAICPGYVDTPMIEQNVQQLAERTGRSQQEIRSVFEQISPQQRLIQPEEVAAMVLYLAQDHAQGITGQAINIDGGTVLF
jgi:NAD(P)-dependent dehydrogenase (short-subunit alcohol dehydrogenase family)